MSDDIARMEKALEEKSNDWALRMVLADAYEESRLDDKRATYLRWSARAKKCPGRFANHHPYPKRWWFWLHAQYDSNTLPVKIWDDWRDMGCLASDFVTMKECEDSLMSLFERDGYPDDC